MSIHRHLFIFVSVCVFGVLLTRIEAQSKSVIPDHITFKHYGVKDGLSESRIYDIIQDRVGFMWFGTRGGLNRFDGQDIVTFKHRNNDRSSLSGNMVWRLFEDRDGYIWAGPSNGGLSRFDPKTETFQQMRINSDTLNQKKTNSVWDIIEDPDGGIWTSVIDEGLEFHNLKTGKVRVFKHDPNNLDSISHNSPSSLTIDAQGRFWVGTYGGGMNLVNRKTGKVTHYRFDPNNPNSLINDFIWATIEDRAGNLWIATDGGLSHFNPATNTFTNFDKKSRKGFSAAQALSVFEDSSGLIWIGAKTEGLFIYDPISDQFKHFSNDPDDPSSLSNNTVFDISQDRDGGYWIATENGVNYYSPVLNRLGRIYGATNDNQGKRLAAQSTRSFYEDEDGLIWVGTEGGGLGIYNPETDLFKYIHRDLGDLENDTIYAMAADSKGVLWLGTSNGISAFSIKTREMLQKNVVANGVDYLKTKNIYSLTIDRQDRLWIASYGEGLIRFNPATGEVKSIARDTNNLNLGLVSDVMADNVGRIWVGTEFGLARFNAGSGSMIDYFLTENQPNSLSSNIINAIFQDRLGRIWIGTNNGLNLYNEENNSFRRLLDNNELPSNLINEIQDDDFGNLWLNTSNGLIRFNPESKRLPHVYNHFDGLQGTHFSRNAALRAKDGTLYFGGRNGFNQFQPNQFKESNIKPTVIITDIRLFNKSIKIGKGLPFDTSSTLTRSITFDDTQSIISFTFAALDYSAPAKIIYKYMLKGFDQDWVKTDAKNRIATYTNLDPGTYTFRVKATNGDGIWNNQSTTLAINILPPWWATIEFRFFASLVVLLILFGLYRFRSYQIRERNIELQKLVEQRSYELNISNDRFRNLFERIPSGVILYESGDDGKEFVVVDLNHAAEKILNVDKQFAIKNQVKNIPPLLYDREVFFNTLRRVYASGVFEHSDPIQVNRNNRDYWYEHFVFRLENKQIVEVISDVTSHMYTSELLKAEKNKAEEASDAKSEFLAHISHEIRTPLSAILGTSHLLAKSTLSDTQNQLVKTLDSSGELLMMLLNDVLDLSRIEAGHLTLGHVPLDLEFLVEHVCDAMKANANAKGIDLIVDITPIGSPVLGDPVRLRQILFNLIGNAVKFTDTGSIIVSVTPEFDAADAQGATSVSIHFNISDTGIGIADNMIDELFEPFSQENSGTARRYGGTGLGLPITKNLIKAMNGEIGVDSEKGEGSSFWFAVDLEYCNESLQIKTNEQVARPPLLSILIVDDLDDTRNIASKLLESEGHRVTQANSGANALAALSENRFDLILMDIRMPDMDGAEAARAIRSLPVSEGRDTPIFAFTADISTDSRVLHKKSGMDATITKPLHLDLLNQTLVDHFGADQSRTLKPKGKPEQTYSLLDQKIIHQFRTIVGIDGLKNQLKRYQITGDHLIKNVTNAMMRHDMEDIARNAHQLAGAAGTIGFQALHKKAIQIETFAEANRIDEIETCLNLISQSQAQSIEAFEALVDKME